MPSPSAAFERVHGTVSSARRKLVKIAFAPGRLIERTARRS
jgi:hypothetical protein